jgi:hypothetical protein
MGVPAYTFVIVCMGVLSATAAIGALALALSQLTPRRKSSRTRPVRQPMIFDAAPKAAPAPAAPPPRPFEPPPQPTRRLELALMSKRAPERLRLPVELARGRILELNLPLLVANSGETDLGDVSIHVTLPNELTYGASLERFGREGLAGLQGATARYALSEHETRIRIDVARLSRGAEARIPVPVSIKHAADAAYPIVIMAFAEGLQRLERCYELELLDPAAVVAPVSSKDAWVCQPDERARQREPHLPLDRIASTEFTVVEAGSVAPARSEPAYEPLSL